MADEGRYTVETIRIDDIKARGGIYMPGLLMPMKGIRLTKYNQMSILSQLYRPRHETTLYVLCFMFYGPALEDKTILCLYKENLNARSSHSASKFSPEKAHAHT
jgi:hypothetical protein